jgi:hypothetical protein
MPFAPDFFDVPTDRRNSDSLKWGLYAGRDVLPLWIADMDFRSAPAITEALERRAAHAVYGYAKDSRAAIEAMIDYHCEHYGFSIDRAWVVPVPGLVCGLNILCRAVGNPGDAVARKSVVFAMVVDHRLDGRARIFRIAVDGVGGAAFERFRDRGRRAEIHVGDPERQHVASGIETPFEAVAVAAVGWDVEEIGCERHGWAFFREPQERSRNSAAGRFGRPRASGFRGGASRVRSG